MGIDRGGRCEGISDGYVTRGWVNDMMCDGVVDIYVVAGYIEMRIEMVQLYSNVFRWSSSTSK